MNWVRTIAGVLVLCSSTAWGATLTWNANSEPDLVGYRVYQCSQQPCTRTSSNASLLVTLGTVTSFNIGTPAVTQYYIITAYDFANNESSESNLATFTPAGSSPPPIAPPPVTPPPVAPPPVAPRQWLHRRSCHRPSGRVRRASPSLRHRAPPTLQPRS